MLLTVNLSLRCNVVVFRLCGVGVELSVGGLGHDESKQVVWEKGMNLPLAFILKDGT